MTSPPSRNYSFGVVDQGLIVEMYRLCGGMKVIQDLFVDLL